MLRVPIPAVIERKAKVAPVAMADILALDTSYGGAIDLPSLVPGTVGALVKRQSLAWAQPSKQGGAAMRQ